MKLNTSKGLWRLRVITKQKGMNGYVGHKHCAGYKDYASQRDYEGWEG